VSSLREALEAALVEDPDDLSAHSAYADLLTDQGDPRGELIQVQLALENESLPREERARLAVRERALLPRVAPACLGEQFSRAISRSAGCLPIIERGWLVALAIESLSRELATELVAAPQARLLRRLRVSSIVPARNGPDNLAVLMQARNMSHLREFALGTLAGFRDEQNEPIQYNSREDLIQAGDDVWDWLASLPRLEELYLECVTVNTHRLFALPNLGTLTILQVNLTDDYPLDILADNAALANLTHLSLHPLARGPHLRPDHLTAIADSPNLTALTHLRFQKSDAGDDGVQALLDSGLADQLTFLDLAMGTITDEGAVLLAEADLENLEVLDLSYNDIGEDGYEALATARFVVRMDAQDHPDRVIPAPSWLFGGELE
jgi:uncharacterized protein (TIGR02996 family)